MDDALVPLLLPVSAGVKAGEITLHLNARNLIVATASPGFIAAAAGAPGWESQVWDSRIPVPITTLDALIAQYGAPDFVKIDVEGHELAVLQGLSTPVPDLSFEFATIQRAEAAACLGRVSVIGRYEFNLSMGEDHVLRTKLAALPHAANAGDIYARHV